MKTPKNIAKVAAGAAGMLCLVGGGTMAAAPVLTHGHMDIGVLYEGGAWDLHLHKEEPPPDEEFAPGDALIQVGPSAALPGGVPNTPSATGFFGPAGSPLWVLPKTEQEDLPFLGIGAEEMDAADWNGNLTLSLDSVNGPGDVFVWDVGAFGDLIPKMSTRDGVGPGDLLEVTAGSHAHYFWAFSAPGEYEVVVKGSGVHAVDGPVASDPVGYRFQVVPEPGAAGLLGAGALTLWISRRQPARHGAAR